MVTWWTHGCSPQSACSVFNSSQAPNLNDNMPAFTLQASCGVGNPDYDDNLGYTLLKHGAVATVSASRVSTSKSGNTGGNDDPTSTQNQYIAYNYTKHIIDGGFPKSAGVSLAETKGVGLRVSRNVQVYNLYGDPDCFLLQTNPNQPPVADANGPYTAYESDTITLDGSGSFDPEGSSLHYRWDLDTDGTFDTDWSTSPFATFSQSEDYTGTARLQVKDELGLTGEDTATVTFLNVIPPCGDVNSDGMIDIVDALMTAQFYVGLQPHSFDESAADVNGDGLIDIVDALLIAQYYVGLIETLPGCGQVNLAGIIIHNNAPMSNITGIEPLIWFRDESTGQLISGVTTTYDTASGAYAFSHLPDKKIGININYHLAGSTETLPGNYSGWEVVDLPVLTPGEIESYNLNVYEIIHLLEPYDNDQRTLRIGPPYPAHSTPVTFSWASVNGTDHYEVKINECNDPPSYSLIQNIASENLTGTDYTTVLPASASETHYEVSIYAYNSADVLIGQYMTTYTNGHGLEFWSCF